MVNIIGTKANDTLQGTNSDDTINGKAGNDTITAYEGKDTLTGGGGNDTFVFNIGDGTDTITDFSGVGKKINPTPAVIGEIDIIKFLGAGLIPQNLLLTQNGTSLEISFEGLVRTKVILKNFKLEDLNNLKASGTKPAIGNILFNGQTSITDSFNVLDANSAATSIGIKNTVTFANDLNNNITGLDDSNDVVNGQGGNDIINGLSGDDLLRGGTGNDTLIGGIGNDTLVAGTRNYSLDSTDEDNSNVNYSLGDNLLDGGDGNDFLSASGYVDYYTNDVYYTSGNNTFNGGAGKDILNVDSSIGNNTLNGGAGADILYAHGSQGKNLLSGGEGNDRLDTSYLTINSGHGFIGSSGNNTLNGGAGNDTLRAEYSTGNNLLSGGDGNDSFYVNAKSSDTAPSNLVTQTVDGGKGDDLLSVDYTNATGGIITTFNPTTNIGSITAGTNLVSYKNIEGLNIIGTGYADNIVGSNGNDTIKDSYDGNDTIIGGAGNDSLSASGSYDNNTLNGGTGNDHLDIGDSSGDNFLDGGDGNDTLSATDASGKNTLEGGNGNDILIGGYGNDSLYGGSGIDTFVFNTYDLRSNTGNRVYDFNATNDVIWISFGRGLSTGSLSANQFQIGASATTSDQKFIYNNITGALFFDEDGTGGGFSQVQFAQLSPGLPLTNNNFVIV